MRKPKLRAKVIVLDLDGTIMDSKEAYFEALTTALRIIGKGRIHSRAGMEIPKRLEQGLPIDDIIEGIDAQNFLKTYLEAYYRATATKTKPLPNIPNTLSRLSKKAKLAVITMRHVPRREVLEELERFGLAKYFQQVITALDPCRPKPSPEALIECTRRLGVETHECIIVGDSVVDIRAGKNAGAQTVAVLSGIFSREELETEKPDLILKSVSELPDFLE
jgi:phosphoglycolate phosphatase